ncbi:DUF2470 domain-containing protein [Microbacterium sp. SSW1-59]|uniref:DUF2470 domain-containing protein n=1 Tax=Microbacterium xanthum TaxID=3079794 RepID=UPI002AD268F2|nr:DUF2470 domain-containing protein [Microbacterium sp. SSW1-59]MDZ8200823.1 DUF2470 domain-containing protein [Microbacterium sp. SSW1-59]
MTHIFEADVQSAVLRHMNGDHTDDNLLITRAFSPEREIVAASMTGFDGAGGTWEIVSGTGEAADVRIDWPGGPITERAEVRREVVALYDEACRRLGVEPRPHA